MIDCSSIVLLLITAIFFTTQSRYNARHNFTFVDVSGSHFSLRMGVVFITSLRVVVHSLRRLWSLSILSDLTSKVVPIVNSELRDGLQQK